MSAKPQLCIHTPARLIRSAVVETSWPTRCIICDKPGTLLCKSCWLTLPFIDQSLACPRCGSPFGSVQCTECNTALLTAAGLSEVPFDLCRSVFTLDDETRKIALTFKDRGERRAGETMARLMAPLTDPGKLSSIDAITYIPDTAAAVRRRGFDHSQYLASRIALLLGKPCLGLLGRPKAHDQRALGRKGRLLNMEHAFNANPDARDRIPSRILLVDDVITTGATLYAASRQLKNAGAKNVYCITFARAW